MASPTRSPFADVIQSLAGLHQEHHQALLDMRADQERRFGALVQNQQEDRELFRSWMDREVRAGGIPTAPAPPTHMPVQKMGPHDDPEAFLDLFERTAEACCWPQTDWPVRLIPLLTGEAQLAAQQLPVQNLLVYDDLKRAILQRVGRSPEQHCQRFRSLELGENGRPFTMAHQLRDACRRWLLAGESDVEQIIDRVVLEQFIARLPQKTAQWVQCCGDPGHFIDRCPVMEVGTLVRVPDAPQAAPDQAGGYQIPVSIKGGTYWALVDSGCNQTSIHQSLIQPEALDKSCMVRVRCVHGDVVKYPVVLLTIQFHGQKHNVKVAVNPHLQHSADFGNYLASV